MTSQKKPKKGNKPASRPEHLKLLKKYKHYNNHEQVYVYEGPKIISYYDFKQLIAMILVFGLFYVFHGKMAGELREDL